MSRSLRAAVRATVTAAVALALFAPAAPAFAATPPATPTGATAAVGDRLLDLSWSGGSGTGAVVRDVTGLATPYTPTTGRGVTPTSATTARDTGFTNRATATYAIWSTEDDGTTSDVPLVTDVAPAPLVGTTLSLATSVAAVPWGRVVTFVGTLKRVGAVPVANVPVELYGRVGGTRDVRLLRRFTTGSNGTARTTLAPSRSTDFSLRFGGDAFSSASESNHRSIAVLPRVATALTPAAIVKGESSVLSGRVVPVLAAAPVAVQRRQGSGWQTIATVRTASNGTFRHVLAPGLGIHTYRAVLLARSSYLQALSRPLALRVDGRDLVSGNRGADVLALQRQLAALHYVPGAFDGAFGYDLVHAVMAFQKVNRLPVTGRWTRAERTRAGTPTAWRLRFPAPGRAVEISLTRQVLVLSEAGKISKIVDISSGNEAVYYVRGERNVAHTPRGRFSVTRKIDGVRVSDLGELYRPSYFVGGYAVHGSPSIPAYPASHGCIRITNGNADRLFSLLTVGTPVAVYDE